MLFNFLMNAVLAAVLSQGARLADPGEFTKRAFLNGRLDLVQAEAVMDVISAQTELALDDPYAGLAFQDLGPTDRMVAEYRMLRFSADLHPLSLMKDQLPPGTVTSDRLPHLRQHATVRIAVQITDANAHAQGSATYPYGATRAQAYQALEQEDIRVIGLAVGQSLPLIGFDSVALPDLTEIAYETGAVAPPSRRRSRSQRVASPSPYRATMPESRSFEPALERACT